ncbi:MAG: EAL domain-containing protein [Pseudomonadota bacterium]
MQVLVVEDNQDDLDLVTMSLRRTDRSISVSGASTIGEARELMAAREFDIALLDLSLPDSFGLSTVKELQRQNDQMPIIVLSGDSNENTALGAARLGVEDFVAKGDYIGAPFVRTLRYAIERKKGEQRLRDMANYDQLTRLSNRQFFNRQLLKAIGHAERSDETLGLLFIDLNEFKAVNDTLGHHVGDQLLAQVAARLKGCVRSNDIVGRLGGDEFAVLAETLTDPLDAEVVGTKIVNTLKQPFIIAGHSISIGASVGIAMYPHDALDAEELMTRADLAMYEAKRNGRGGVLFYSEDLNYHANERTRMIRELRAAMEHSEFDVYYQPKVCTSTHDLVGLEALLRWHHPTRGTLLPSEFVPFAEDNGMMAAIDEVVLGRVADDLVAWQAEDLDLVPVSVNVSAAFVLREDLFDTITALIERTNVDPNYLEFQLTESVLRAEHVDTRKALARIHAMGIGIWLNDFGNGYSTLGYLNELPMDGICIASAFVHSLDQRRTQAIVRSIVTLAENLDLGVAAVGVETEAQLMMLKEVGCDRAQGYYYGEPMNIDLIKDRFLTDRQGTVTSIMRALPLQELRRF